MGTRRMQRMVSSDLTEKQLEAWFKNKLREMAEDNGGIGPYCGNWNANSGLNITNKTFPNDAAAEAYFERTLSKNGDVLAVRIGSFDKAWPATKEQKTMVARLEELETEDNEFEYNILLRAQKQKSKTKKCSHCESSINVHKLTVPSKTELETTNRGGPEESSYRYRGRVMLVNLCGLTDCPVCFKNLLKTDTDTKNHESLKKRISELHAKVIASKLEFEKANAGKPHPYWLLAGDCGE